MCYGLIMLSWIVALITGIFILGMAIFLIRETYRKDGKSDEKYRAKAEEMEKKTWEMLIKK